MSGSELAQRTRASFAYRLRLRRRKTGKLQGTGLAQSSNKAIAICVTSDVAQDDLKNIALNRSKVGPGGQRGKFAHHVQAKA